MIAPALCCALQLLPPASDAPAAPAGVRWTFETPAGAFVGADLAQHATFAWGTHAGDGAARLFARSDADPPTALWSLEGLGEPLSSAAAAEGDRCAVIARRAVGGPNEYRYTLEVGDSQGPAWSFEYPPVTTGFARVGLSRDGGRAVAAFVEPATSAVELFVFEAETGALRASWSLPGGALWALELSDDARRVALSVERRVLVVQLATGAVLFEYESPTFLSNRPVALSGDGETLAYVADGIRVHRSDGGSYAPLFTQVVPGSVQRLALSRRGERLAWGVSFFTFPEPTTEVWTQCLDVATQALTMTEVVSSSGSLPNYQVDIALDDAGEVLAVAQAGDEPDLVEELRVFRFDQDTPLFTLNLPGSAEDVDLSGDGRWVLVGSRAEHFQRGAGGGRLDLVHLGGDDLELDGVPSLGAQVTWTAWGEPGRSAWLLFGRDALDPPLDLGPAGSLWLASPVRRVPLGTLPPGGSLSVPFGLPAEPALAGAAWAVQAGFLPGPRLGGTWLPLTLLP